VGNPLIYFISDGSINEQNYDRSSAAFLRHLELVVAAAIPLVQIREKQLSTRSLFDLAIRAVVICKGSKTKLLINDRLDVALAAGADGVHLTGSSVRAETMRSPVPADFLNGVSTHSCDEVAAAAASGADFAVFGPVFSSPGKGAAAGLEALRKAVDAAGSFPILGLGGIDEMNYRDVLATGAAGFAAIRFLNDPRNLETLKSEFHL
jgi:thiamine-phosphate pyrophosphorylase